ncbi:MAG: hypothetical protein ACYDHY_07455 [Acidiferrobacterales bacterium]
MSYDIVQETVPGFIKRLGDKVLQGSNNTLIWMGTDRADAGPADIDTGLGTLEASGKGTGTGTVMIVAGRNDTDGNPDLDADLAYIYVTMKSKIDDNLGLTSVETATAGTGEPGVLMKSDNLRLVFRKNIKIALDGGKNYVFIDDKVMTCNMNGTISKLDGDNNVMTITANPCVVTIDGKNDKVTVDASSNGTVTVNANAINLGADGASHPAVLGDLWMTQFNNFLNNDYATHSHATSMGPSGPASSGIPPAPLPNSPMTSQQLSTITQLSK